MTGTGPKYPLATETRVALSPVVVRLCTAPGAVTTTGRALGLASLHRAAVDVRHVTLVTVEELPPPRR